MKKKVAIIGTVGLPACYGGFETLADYLVKHLNTEHDMYVYCSGHTYTKNKRQKTYNNAKLIYIPLQANGIQSVIYDCISIIHAIFYADILLILGVPGAIVLPIVKLLTRKKIIVSIDGIEWKRDKWNRFARWYLRIAEKIAVKFSHIDISDNEAIQDYTALSYRTQSRVIEYGGDHTQKQKITSEHKTIYPFLSHPYAFKVCRIEPENNVDMVLEAFSSLQQFPFVMVGNWNNSDYGKRLKTHYSAFPNIHLLDPIYNQNELDLLRSNAHIYIHGHSAGGTNPSLVEAMYLGLPVIAFNVGFNKATTEHKAIYFSSTTELRKIIINTPIQIYKIIGQEMRSISLRRYRWEIVAQKYNYIIRQAAGGDTKTSTIPDISTLSSEELLQNQLGQFNSIRMFYE